MSNWITETCEIAKRDAARRHEREEYVREMGGCPDCECVPAEQGIDHWDWCKRLKVDAELEAKKKEAA